LTLNHFLIELNLSMRPLLRHRCWVY